MPDLPNIQREVLKYVLENADGPHRPVDLRNSPLAEKYGEGRVARKAGETGVLSFGTSMLYPWYMDEEAVEKRIEDW